MPLRMLCHTQLDLRLRLIAHLLLGMCPAGQGSFRDGADGNDLYIRVPVGTIIRRKNAEVRLLAVHVDNLKTQQRRLQGSQMACGKPLSCAGCIICSCIGMQSIHS